MGCIWSTTKHDKASQCTNDMKYECNICCQKTIEQFFVPCGHAYCCTTCGTRFKNCAICDSIILDRGRIYFCY